MTKEKQNLQGPQEDRSAKLIIPSGTVAPGAAYATLNDPVRVYSNTFIPLAPLINFGDYVTWSTPYFAGPNQYYRSFQLKSGYYYSIFYRALIRSTGTVDPGLEILLNGNPLDNSLIAEPAVSGKAVPLSNSMVVYSDDDTATYQLASISAGIVTSLGLSIDEQLALASVTISVLGDDSSFLNMPRR
ncbi:hypothetical protein J40TS1_12890 [Paenibacillus montaniterrae]|uniref:Uncharacterized protein n=1 Tax=Paenibacillus montaniterrae TaxID=429341 RepID=A0A919YJQ0_9BACL|nr:hypothetical protein [Paenibacillus montaniterrae]GIP15647.1 hypothetical protein J40TS1_12890 [Paenibacillus montaniterrae]